MRRCVVLRSLGSPRVTSAARTLSTAVVAFAASIVLMLAGCASTNGIASHAEVVDPAALGARGADPVLPLAPDWWLGTVDPRLASLIDQAVAGSPSLRLAEARQARAAALVSGARASGGPRLDGAVDLSRQRFSENGIYPPPLAGSIREIGTAQLNGGWEIDVFGRNRAALDAAIGNARAAAADAAAARVMLAVNVARGWTALSRAVEHKAVLERSLAQRAELHDLTRQRYGAGLDTVAELRQSEASVREVRTQVTSAEEQIELARHGIAALAALPPDALDDALPMISKLLATPLPEQVPASLLSRRADIAAARWRIEAATGDVAAARAQFYPSVNLTAFVGLNSIGFDRLLRGGSTQWGAGPAIRLPILDSGMLRANLRGRSADLDAAVEIYNANVVDAIHDVADQIASTRFVDRQQREQREALNAAEAAYDVATQRYKAGLATYLTVLNAESIVLVQRRNDVDVRARQIDVRMLLVRALGGGYVAQAPVALPVT